MIQLMNLAILLTLIMSQTVYGLESSISCSHFFETSELVLNNELHDDLENSNLFDADQVDEGFLTEFSQNPLMEDTRYAHYWLKYLVENGVIGSKLHMEAYIDALSQFSEIGYLSNMSDRKYRALTRDQLSSFQKSDWIKVSQHISFYLLQTILHGEPKETAASLRMSTTQFKQFKIKIESLSKEPGGNDFFNLITFATLPTIHDLTLNSNIIAADMHYSKNDSIFLARTMFKTTLIGTTMAILTAIGLNQVGGILGTTTSIEIFSPGGVAPFGLLGSYILEGIISFGGIRAKWREARARRRLKKHDLSGEYMHLQVREARRGQTPTFITHPNSFFSQDLPTEDIALLPFNQAREDRNKFSIEELLSIVDSLTLRRSINFEKLLTPLRELTRATTDGVFSILQDYTEFSSEHLNFALALEDYLQKENRNSVEEKNRIIDLINIRLTKLRKFKDQHDAIDRVLEKIIVIKSRIAATENLSQDFITVQVKDLANNLDAVFVESSLGILSEKVTREIEVLEAVEDALIENLPSEDIIEAALFAFSDDLAME